MIERMYNELDSLEWLERQMIDQYQMGWYHCIFAGTFVKRLASRLATIDPRAAHEQLQRISDML